MLLESKGWWNWSGRDILKSVSKNVRHHWRIKSVWCLYLSVFPMNFWNQEFEPLAKENRVPFCWKHFYGYHWVLQLFKEKKTRLLNCIPTIHEFKRHNIGLDFKHSEQTGTIRESAGQSGFRIYPPETNIAPEKWWLEAYFPFGKSHFRVLC